VIFHHRQPVDEGGGAKEKERVGGREGGREEGEVQRVQRHSILQLSAG